jgi:hypothetical protein
MWKRVLGASIALMVLSIVGFVGTILWHSFGGDYDKYGRVDIPGSATLTLPRGRIDINYSIRLATNGGGGAISVPNLHFDMDLPDGVRDPVVTNSDGGSVSVNSAAHVRVWRVEILDPGTYTVNATGDVDGYIEPQLAFGVGSRVPAWPIAVAVVLFFVSLGLMLVASQAAQHEGRPGGRPERVRMSVPQPGQPPYGSPSPPTTQPVATTPDQELARLARLQQLTDLHASGTLSDAEYDAAKGRLGG